MSKAGAGPRSSARTLVGATWSFILIICAMAVCAAPATAGKPGALPIRGFEIDAYQEIHDLSSPQAEQALLVQRSGAGITEQLEQIEGDNYAGVWFDANTSKFVIPISDASLTGDVKRFLAASKLASAYRLDPVETSWDKLMEVQRSVDRTLKDQIESNLVQTSLDPRSNAVVVDEAGDLDPATAESISALARHQSARVLISEAPVDRFDAEPAACATWTVESFPYRACDRPLRGGVVIEAQTVLCSAGFAATGRQFGNHFVLTAGHCVQEGNKQWRGYDAERNTHYLGEVEASMFPGRDYAAIRVKPGEPGNENYWEGGPEGWVSRVVEWGGSQNIPIEYEAASYLGELVCHSGTRTGTNCGTVAALNKTVNYPEGTVYYLTEASYTGDHGDSGGSVWAGNTALGLVSGGISGTSVSYFQEITEATDALGVTVGARLPAPPWSHTTPATGVGGREATLNGEVDAAATETSYHFDYGLTASYGSATSTASAGSGHNPVSLSGLVQGLTPVTQYHYRIVAENAAGTAPGNDVTFTTTTAAPLARTGSAASRGQTSAIVNGEVEAGGLQTSYQVEYGTTTAYGSITGSANVGASTGWVQVQGFLSSLKPETTYHYRLKASNSKGVAYGEDKTFTTLARPAVYDFAFGQSGGGAGEFSAPVGAAIDASGNLWVADTGNNRLEKFGPKGEYLTQFGSKGSGNGQFLEPLAVAVTPSGNLWVADAGNGRIEEFSASGVYLQQFGNGPEGLLEQDYIARPAGIAIDAEGNIWVSDPGNQRVEKFTESSGLNGHFRGGFSGIGLQLTEAEKFKAPAGISADREGNLWFVDSAKNWLVELERGENILKEVEFHARVRAQTSGSGEGGLSEPYAVAVKPSGNLLVAEKGNNRVQQLSPAGEYLAQFGLPGSGAGQFSGPRGIAAGPGGTIYVVDTGNNRVERWNQPTAPEATTQPATALKATEATLNASVNPSGKATTYQFEYGTTVSYGSKAPASPASAGSGADPIAVSQTLTGLTTETIYHFRVVATSSEGTVYGQDKTFTTTGPPYDFAFGSAGTGNGQFNGPGGVAVDASGNVWVVDRGNNRLEKFNAKGEYLTQFGSKGSGNGQFLEPRDVAITSAGNLWVTDAGNGRLQEFSSAGTFIREVGIKEGGLLNPVDHLKEPFGVAIGAENRVWVSDPGNCAVELFSETSSNGKYFVGQQKGFINPCTATEKGAFQNPNGIGTDGEGNAWVTDAALSRITELTAKKETNPLGETVINISAPFMFGTKGSAPGQLLEPAGVTVLAPGKLAVTDRGNNRVQQFTAAGEFLRQFGSLGSGAEQFSGPRGIAATSGGAQYVTDPGNNRVEKWG